jgi:hypothetical protein
MESQNIGIRGGALEFGSTAKTRCSGWRTAARAQHHQLLVSRSAIFMLSKAQSHVTTCRVASLAASSG